MRLFISYAHEDVKPVQQLVDILRAGGYEAWFDTQLLPGQDWQAELLAGIMACDAFVYVLSPASLESDWCRWEFAEAVKLGKPVLPVLIRKAAIPPSISRYQYVNFSDGIDLLDVARLIGGLANLSVTIPREHAPDVSQNPRGLPAQAVMPSPRTPLPQGDGRLALPDVSYVLPPPFEWCDVPAGWVTLEDASVTGGSAGGKFHVRRFFLAKYPITNSQYRVFLNAEDGFIQPRWWDFSDSAKAWRAANPAPVETGFAGDDLPRSNVTWYEAVAFCRWLTERVSPSSPRWFGLAQNNAITITLPTELQWQRAAQGDDGRAYPWGMGFDRRRANTEESGIRKVTAAAQYANGASPYAVLDMAGNTWDWCLTEWGTDSPALTGTNARAIRGGSWNHNQEVATCGNRGCQPPETSDNGFGFRVCVDLRG